MFWKQILISIFFTVNPPDKPASSSNTNGSDGSVPLQLGWIKARTESRFTWKFKNVKTLFYDCASSKSKFFYCQLIPWSISIQLTKVGGKAHLGVFLWCEYKIGGGVPFRCKTSFELRLLSIGSGTDKDKTANINCEFNKIAGFGEKNLISYDELMNVSNGYVREDSLLVQVHLKAEPLCFG